MAYRVEGPGESLTGETKGKQVTSADELQDLPVDIRLWDSRTDAFDDVVALMRQSHEIDVSEEWLATKLSWGDGGIAAVAYAGDRPVGLALVGYAPYRRGGREASVMWSLDNFVVEDYRGRGIYHQLLSRLTAAIDESAAGAVLTFPNSRSRPGFEKAGWVPMSPMWAYARPIIGINPVTNARRLKNLATSMSRPFELIDTAGLARVDVEFLAQHAGHNPGLAFDASAAALEWRFDSRRGRGYEALILEESGAVVRLGRRGPLREVQIMATFPRVLSGRGMRRLLAAVTRKYRPDLITVIGNRELTSRQALAVGLWRLKKVTTPLLRPRAVDETAVLSGIDLHLW